MYIKMDYIFLNHFGLVCAINIHLFVLSTSGTYDRHVPLPSYFHKGRVFLGHFLSCRALDLSSLGQCARSAFLRIITKQRPVIGQRGWASGIRCLAELALYVPLVALRCMAPQASTRSIRLFATRAALTLSSWLLDIFDEVDHCYICPNRYLS